DQRCRGAELTLEQMDVATRVERKRKLGEGAAATCERKMPRRQHVPAGVVPDHGCGDVDQPEQLELIRDGRAVAELTEPGLQLRGGGGAALGEQRGPAVEEEVRPA